MKLPSILSCALCLAAMPASAQTTWYVDDDGIAPGSGTPADPFASVQHAIEQATTVDGDTVLVLPGLYDESIDFLGKVITVRSFDGPGSTILRGDPAADPPRSVVTFASGEGAGSVLSGFTVREGNGRLVGAETRGGGVFVDAHCAPLLRGLVIEENRADRGGGVYALLSDLRIVDSSFRANQARLGGGALYLDKPETATTADTTVRSCTFQGNVAETDEASNMHGAGLHATETDLFVARSVFTGNRGDKRAGGLYYGSSPAHHGWARNCTFVGNESVLGGGIYAAGEYDVVSAILWNNLPDQVGISSGAPVTVAWSDVQGGHTGTGNIDADPRFWDALGGDYHLEPGSPCIDAGDPSATDPDGSRVDMGALPFDPGYCPEPAVYCEAKQSSAGCLPRIGFVGSPSLSSGEDFLVVAAEVPNQQNGLLFWSRIPAALPFAGGTLCVAAPIVRTPIQNSGGDPAPASNCSGAFAFAFDALYLTGVGLELGDTVHAQYWLRDPAHPDGTGVGLSDALRFLICP